MSMLAHQAFSGWAYIARAEDVPGTWLASCPDYGIMTHGDSPAEALEMIREAVDLVIVDVLGEGGDPQARRSEDPEDWAPLLRLFGSHREIHVGELDSTASRSNEFAVQFTLVFKAVDGGRFALDPSINHPQPALMAVG